MSIAVYPHLCAGVFFHLLLDARQFSNCPRANYSSEEYALSQNKLSLALTRLIIANFPTPKDSSLDNNVSQMSNCRKEKLGAAVPFYTGSYSEGLKARIKDSYSSFLIEWSNFLSGIIDFQDQYQYTTFAKSILEIIDHDENFLGCCAARDGSYLSRDQLLKAENLWFQSFLLGVWLWICETTPSNAVENDLFDAWASSKKGSFEGHDVKILIDSLEDIKIAASASSKEETNAADNTDIPKADAEIVDDIPSESKTDTSQKVLQQAGIVMNNSGSGPQIGVVNGNVNFNF